MTPVEMLLCRKVSAGRDMEMKEATFVSRLRQRGRISPSPLAGTVSRVSSGDVVVKNLAQRSAAAWRNHEVERQAAEIERLVRLAEQSPVERRQQPSSVTSRPMPQHSKPQRPATTQDMILVPTAKMTPAMSTADTLPANCVGRPRSTKQSRALALSQLVDVKSLERCPKCRKVRLEIRGSSNQEVAAPLHQTLSSRPDGGCGPRLVKFKALVSDLSAAASGQSQDKRTPVRAAERFGVKTAATTTRVLNTDHSMCNNRHRNQTNSLRVAGAVVVPSDGEDKQDVNNNNYNEEFSKTAAERSTWPRKANDCRTSNGGDSLSKSPDDGGGRTARVRKRPSLSAVQQAWTQRQSMQRTDGDGEVERLNVDDRPPSAASSYDPLDTVVDADCTGSVYIPTFPSEDFVHCRV